MAENQQMPSRDSKITLREINKSNLRAILNLKVAPHQEKFVAPNSFSICQAYFDREIAWFRGIYADDTPIGFLMLQDEPETRTYYLWRFMIDHRYQGMGFGTRAIELLLEHVRTRPGATALTLSCVPGEGTPGTFYEKLGFFYTGEMEEDERVMRRDLE